MSSKIRSGGGCSAIGCSMRRNTNLLSEVKMYRFPTDPIRKAAWCIALRRKNWTPTKNSLLCNAHFITGKKSDDPQHPDYVPSIFKFNQIDTKEGEKKMNRYERSVKRVRCDSLSGTSDTDIAQLGIKRRLKRNAVPSLNLPVSNPESADKVNKAVKQKKKKKLEQERHATILWYDKEKLKHGEHHATVIRFPQNPELQIQADERENQKPGHHTRLCSDNFSEEDIRKSTCVRIRETAVPSQSKAFPCNLQEDKEKFPLKTEDREKITEKVVLQSVPVDKHLLPVESSPENSREKYKDDSVTKIFKSLLKGDSQMKLDESITLYYTSSGDLTFKNLLENLLVIKKPNDWWTLNPVSNLVICARWNSENFISEKRVVINSDFRIRVFLKEWEINISELMDITCIDDISVLLEKMENYKIP